MRCSAPVRAWVSSLNCAACCVAALRRRASSASSCAARCSAAARSSTRRARGGVPAGAQMRKFGGHPRRALFGTEACLREFRDLGGVLAGVLGGGRLQPCHRRGRLEGALLSRRVRGAGFLALALELTEPIGLAVQQLLCGAQLPGHRLEGLLQVLLVIGAQLRQCRPGVRTRVLIRGRRRHRIEHRQLGRAVQIGLTGGRRRRHRTRTHRLIPDSP